MEKAELYEAIGRKVVAIARQAEIVSFAAKAKKGAGKKSQNCNPSKSHSCTRPDGSNYCISLNRKCKMPAKGSAKQAADYTAKKVESPGDYTIPKTGRDSVDAETLDSDFGANEFFSSRILGEMVGGKAQTVKMMEDVRTEKDLNSVGSQSKLRDGFIIVDPDSNNDRAKQLADIGGTKFNDPRIEGGGYLFVKENGKMRPLTEPEKDKADTVRARWDLHNEAVQQFATTLPWAAADVERVKDRPRILKQALAGFNKKADEHRKTTEDLWALEDKAFDRKPTKLDQAGKQKLSDDIKAEAVSWAKSMGFDDGGVNGFTAEQTKAHDIAHPATHRLVGLNSQQIHKAFGNLKDKDGKPSLLAEEALVNAVEHLSRGDSREASIQNALRLARVLSRSGTEAEKKYVRSPEFARGIIDLVDNRIYKNNEYSNIMPIVREANIVSGTVTASGSDFTNSASGG